MFRLDRSDLQIPTVQQYSYAINRILLITIHTSCMGDGCTITIKHYYTVECCYYNTITIDYQIMFSTVSSYILLPYS